MPSPDVGEKHHAKVENISRTGHPMAQKDDWDEPVVILTPAEDYSVGDQIKFIIKQELKDHYQAKLPDSESDLTSPTFNRIYRGEVSGTMNGGNPVIRHSDWDKHVEIITEDSVTVPEGDQVKFVVKKDIGDRYQALLSHKAPAVKPHYGSRAVIPIHHDGKDNQSVGDTRSERHATKSVDERS
jgi:hypothetical protein